MSRKRAPHRSKDPVETPRNDPIVLKRSRPADPEQDPDPAESSVARPTGSAGATLLLVAAAVQDVEESTNDVVAPETHDDAGSETPTGAGTVAPAESRKKRRNRPRGRGSAKKNRALTSNKYAAN